MLALLTEKTTTWARCYYIIEIRPLVPPSSSIICPNTVKKGREKCAVYVNSSYSGLRTVQTNGIGQKNIGPSPGGVM